MCFLSLKLFGICLGKARIILCCLICLHQTYLARHQPLFDKLVLAGGDDVQPRRCTGAEAKYSADLMCVLPTMYRRTRYGAKAIDALIDSELPTFFRDRGGLLRINACAAVQEAVSEHMPLCDYSPKCKATEQYLELARKVMAKVEG